MSSKKLKKALALALSLLMIITAVPFTSLAIDFNPVGDDKGIYLVSDTKTNIAPGITENKIITNNKTNSAQVRGYVVTADPTQQTVGFRSGFANMDGTKWKMASVRSQAAALEKKYGENVVVGVNADIFNMATGEPTHVLVMDGVVYKKGLGSSYVGTTKDGKFVMGGYLTQEVLDTLQEAVGGFYMLVENGKRVNQNAQSVEVPKTAVGKKADGSIIFYVADGRDYPNSCGLNDTDLSTVMLDLGCVDVINLDGGGSTTYLAKVEGSDRLECRNKPSDGTERNVSSSFFITSSAKPSGVFDHANLTPNNEIYTPNSEVSLTATGVDSSGTKTDLPTDGAFALADKSFGSIVNDKFVSNGKEGEVTVNYTSGGAVCGSTTFEIRTPDTIAFADEEVSLGFDAVSDLSLTVKYKSRDVVIKPGDIEWTLSNPAIGTFDGNIFMSSSANSSNGVVTAASKWDSSVSGSVKVIVGMLPSVVWDFEDVNVTDESGNVTSTIPAEEYYTGANGILTHSNYGRGGKESVEIVNIDDEEPVRFGSHSMKLNYDFINCGAVTEGACVGSTEEMAVPGNPTGIGVWVYAPEGVGIKYQGPGTQSGLWLRGYVKDGSGAVLGMDYTLEPKLCVDKDGNWNGVQPGVSWEGWAYCEASLAGKQGPFKIQKGMTFRLMYVYGTQMGTKSAGSIYMDNLQFVYGTNVDDVDNPIIDSVTANGKELKNGDVLTTNTVNFDGFFHDVKNKYTTDIDVGTVRMFVDGVNTANNDNYQYVVDPDGSKNHLYDVNLENGEHSVTVTIRDGFGNETTETRFFTVDGQKTDAPIVSVAPAEKSAVIGKTVSLNIKATDTSAIDEVMTGISFGSQFKDYTVSFADGFTGTYKYNKLSKVLTLNAEKSGAVSGNTVATVTFNVPTTLNASATFDYTVKAGSYTANGKDYTYSAAEKSLPVTAEYLVSAEPIIVGEKGTIHVENEDGTNASGVKLYLAEDNSEIGTTDEDGNFVTDMFSSQAGFYTVYAKDSEGLLSFQYIVGTYDSNGANEYPYGILNNAVKDPTTMKSISWLSSPTKAGKQTLQYKTADSEDWTTVNAKSVKKTFTKGSNSAVTVNSVVLENLVPNTAYEYKVGSGEFMSDVLTFKTNESKDNASFFVLGDIQADDLTNINNITSTIATGDYDFGIQTGDTVDDPTSYIGWTDAIGFTGVDKIGSKDLVHVLGNHEYAGDANADRAGAIYNLPDSNAGGHYSVTYGNVYVAVINYSGNTNEYREALNWLIKDAKASDATWKVLSIHQPAYYSNVGGGNGDVHAILPRAVEEAGINFVFSGHDHSFARTKPLTNDVEDNENGVVYYICGSAGEKKYDITDSFGFEQLTQDYDGIYISAKTTKHTFTVETYDIGKGMIDSYTMYDECSRNGHNWEYSSKTDAVTCSVCGDENDAYTGFMTDKETGKTVFFENGAKHIGWLVYVDDAYYFDENGFGVQGKKTIDYVTSDYTEKVTYEFTKEGKQKAPVFHKDKHDGETRAYVGGEVLHGWQLLDGNYYYFSANSGRMLKGNTYTITFRLGDKGNFTFDKNGVLQGNSIVTTKEGVKRGYYGPEMLTGWQTVGKDKYYFDLENGAMATGEVVIDDEIYCFSNDGVFLHEGAHEWKGDQCKICGLNTDGTITSTNPFIAFFQRIINFFKKLFGIK